MSSPLAFLLLSLAALPDRPAALTEPQLAARVDELLAARWKQKGKVVPAPLTGDAAFIRRVYLDLGGRIPSILEVRDFLDDDRPDKRRIWVDQLLAGVRKDAGADTWSDHFSALWAEVIVPPGSEDRGPYLTNTFQGWLRQQMRQNVAYDEIVRRVLLSDPGQANDAGAYYQANENKPESLAGATTRLFLGIKLECAQCHDDRSGGSWSRDQFWEMASFFAGTGLEIPNTKRRVAARFLDGTKPKGPAGKQALAAWVTSPDNPYFARAAVNRVWGYLFGIGLIDPVDDRGDHNPPSHPELLDELAQQFVLNKFDLKYLLRALVLTQAYQRVSLQTDPSQADARLFARMQVRGLSAAQLFDSLAEATEFRSDRSTPNPYADPSRRLTPREDFLVRFTSQDRSTETHTSILQALHLMNGPFMARSVSLESNRTLATIADAARIDTGHRLETLFLVALSRKPAEKELARLVAYVNKGGPTGNPKKALADIFWALLNSAEFRLNH